MKNKKIYLLLAIIPVIILLFIMHTILFGKNEDNKNKNLLTNDFKLDYYSNINGVAQYGSYIKENGEKISLLIKAKDYKLPQNLYDYKDDIRLRITYSQDDYKVYDCKIINFKTGEIIKDLSEKNINKLFNIEYGKQIVEKAWTDKIKLSELEDKEIYKYKATSTTQFPKIENDIEKNCIIYVKERDEENYERKIKMYKKVSVYDLTFSFHEYNSGETFNIMYRVIGNDELLNSIQKDEIIYLSDYKDGDELKYSFEEYIYNDTEENIMITSKDTFYSVEESNSVIINKGEIYEFDSFIDSASIKILNE